MSTNDNDICKITKNSFERLSTLVECVRFAPDLGSTSTVLAELQALIAKYVP
jgi:hypothetical protein